MSLITSEVLLQINEAGIQCFAFLNNIFFIQELFQGEIFLAQNRLNLNNKITICKKIVNIICHKEAENDKLKVKIYN